MNEQSYSPQVGSHKVLRTIGAALLLFVAAAVVTVAVLLWVRNNNQQSSLNDKNAQIADLTKQVATLKAAQSTAPTPQVTYKTYNDSTVGISFQYPSTWTVGQVVVSGISRTVKVTTDQGDTITLSSGGQGIGGTCGPAGMTTYSVIDTSTTNLKADKPVSLSMTIVHNTDGSYDGTYGLTSTFTTVGDTQTCPNLFNNDYIFNSTKPNDLLMSFSGTKHFASRSDATTFVQGSDYAAIKKMILSLTY